MGGVLDLGQVVGPQGPQGPKGDTGPQGNTGPQGVTGANGITPNIQVGTVTTLPPGSDATFTRRADSPDAAPVFDVGLPRGADSVNDGDMKTAMYDPTGKEQDIFAYADTKANSAEANAKNHAYSKEQSLSAETAALYGKDETAVPDDILAAIPISVNAGWQLLQEWTVAGTYTWTAPDLFGGEDYEIGVMVISGAASGGANRSGSSGVIASAFGGTSGNSFSFILGVSPGSSYRCVVGSGGTSVTTGATNQMIYGKNGGTSSFNNVSVLGGIAVSNTSLEFYGAIKGSGDMGFYGGHTSKDGGCNPAMCINPFENTSILGSGGAPGKNGGKNLLTGNGGGDGLYTTASSTAQSGTEPGCGGGAVCVYYTTSNAYSGKGADGAVKLYIRRIAS